MPQFERTHVMYHKAQDMFALVADIEKYPEFLPMCEQLSIRDRREQGDNVLLIADMIVKYKHIRQAFTSQVLLQPHALVIEAQYIDGPFKYFNNRWRFTDVNLHGTFESQSKVHFYIDYAFKNIALSLLMGTMFERVFARFTQSFESRADEIYGQ